MSKSPVAQHAEAVMFANRRVERFERVSSTENEITLRPGFYFLGQSKFRVPVGTDWALIKPLITFRYADFTNEPQRPEGSES